MMYPYEDYNSLPYYEHDLNSALEERTSILVCVFLCSLFGLIAIAMILTKILS